MLTQFPLNLRKEIWSLLRTTLLKFFKLCYVGNYRIVSFKGNQVEVHKTEGGNTTWVHLTDVKYILPVDNVITKLPDYQSFGRKTKLRLNPGQDTQSTLEFVYHTEYDTNFNDTTVTYTDKYSLCLITHEKSFKKINIKKKKKQIIISLKVRFIKTCKLKLNIRFSIVKE